MKAFSNSFYYLLISDDKIGITTGVTYYYDEKGEKRIVWHNPWHTTGALKFYRRACFDSLGKMEPDLGWDGADEMKAMAAQSSRIEGLGDVSANYWTSSTYASNRLMAAYFINTTAPNTAAAP